MDSTVFSNALGALNSIPASDSSNVANPSPDTDGDGMPDYFEVFYGLNPLYAAFDQEKSQPN
jgi:hypothetical protein